MFFQFELCVTSWQGVCSKVVWLEALQEGADTAQAETWQNLGTDGAVCEDLLRHHQQVCSCSQLREEGVSAAATTD